MNGVALTLGPVLVGIGVTGAVGLRLLPTMRLRLGALVLAAVSLPLGIVLTSGWVMFGMHDDVKIVSVSVGSALFGLIGAV